MNKYKHAGIILAVATLVAVLHVMLYFINFLLQNSLTSGTDDLLLVLSGYDFMSHKEISFVILIPTAIIGMVILQGKRI